MDNPFGYEPIEEIKEALQNNEPAVAVAKIQKYLDQQNKIPLHISITRESGSGKSKKYDDPLPLCLLPAGMQVNRCLN